MNGRKSHSVIRRIQIAEDAVEKGIEFVSKQFDIDPNVIHKWICQIDSLKDIRENELKRKREASKNNGKKFRDKHVFERMVKNLNRNLRNIGQNENHNVTANVLWSLAKKQKCRCAISGIKLTKDNVSIDHIKPLSKGGKTEIENIQIVDRHVNVMKNDKSLDELLFFCREIVKNNLY